MPWNTVEGRKVINMAPLHFVTTHGRCFSATVDDVFRADAAVFKAD